MSFRINCLFVFTWLNPFKRNDQPQVKCSIQLAQKQRFQRLSSSFQRWKDKCVNWIILAWWYLLNIHCSLLYKTKSKENMKKQKRHIVQHRCLYTWACLFHHDFSFKANQRLKSDLWNVPFDKIDMRTDLVGAYFEDCFVDSDDNSHSFRVAVLQK